MTFRVIFSAVDRPPGINSIIKEYCGDDIMVVHGEVFHLNELPMLIHEVDSVVRGFCVFKLFPKYLEIIAINALMMHQGIGTLLLNETKKIAVSNNVNIIKVTTTNENIGAISFYYKMGFVLDKVDVDAVDKARIIKPSIPEFDDEGIRIKDELCFSLVC